MYLFSFNRQSYFYNKELSDEEVHVIAKTLINLGSPEDMFGGLEDWDESSYLEDSGEVGELM